MTALLHDILASYALPERPLDAPDTGSLTTDEENGIQAVLEQRAADECDECTETFRDWLHSRPGIWARQDYRAYRLATASEDERAEILRNL